MNRCLPAARRRLLSNRPLRAAHVGIVNCSCKPIMPDVFTRTKRSEVMSRIRAHGNRDTELRLIALFRRYGITGWRRNARVFGKPDFVFPKQRVAVFVDGCFWHRHPRCKFAYTPKSRL